ncbi:hypothetical protein EJ04DRAFT_509545 [Polyplosphaeria fusca]|uniref:Uncharacterized protein n=1 Tax=Polyplosphaeria fusca TaxID=682080 RepID=A0A9P4R421_9PLEO|nr:hypothetical protein EJ04DRAFT_509545 [Polyplosphaeria fusca]
MTENRANSGVRNLRAMFETQNASPEPRGRSPASHNDPADNDSRPTSKIRASFVSVERPGDQVPKDLGATKSTPGGINDPHAHRRGSFSISDGFPEDDVNELKRVVSEEKENTLIPEEAVASRESSRPAPPIRQTSSTMPNLGAIMKGSDFPEPSDTPNVQQSSDTQAGAKAKDTLEELTPKAATEPVPVPQSIEAKAEHSDKPASGAQEKVAVPPEDLKDEPAIKDVQETPVPKEQAPPLESAQNETLHAPATPAAPAALEPETNGTTSQLEPTAKTVGKKPAAISTSTPKTTSSKITTSAKSPLPKSPGVGVSRPPKTPTTPKVAPSASTARSPLPTTIPPKTAGPSKEPAKAAAPKPSRQSLRPSTTATASSATAKTKLPVQEAKKQAVPKPAPAPKENTSTSPGGFKKPRPKSPTRPVRLPSHLTAPTASSKAKHEEEQQKVARRPSTATRTAPKPAPTAHKPSRQSLAPSSASTTTQRPESRTSTKGAPGASFLERMQRPTAASQKKVHEKLASPPRKGSSAQASSKSRTGQESVIAKGKKKMSEVASKAKEAVTNGHGEDEAHAEPEEPADPAATNGTPVDAQAPEEPVPTGQDTPEQVESSAVELQTPNFEGQAIR